MAYRDLRAWSVQEFCGSSFGNIQQQEAPQWFYVSRRHWLYQEVQNYAVLLKHASFEGARAPFQHFARHVIGQIDESRRYRDAGA